MERVAKGWRLNRGEMHLRKMAKASLPLSIVHEDKVKIQKK